MNVVKIVVSSDTLIDTLENEVIEEEVVKAKIVREKRMYLH